MSPTLMPDATCGTLRGEFFWQDEEGRSTPPEPGGDTPRPAGRGFTLHPAQLSSLPDKLEPISFALTRDEYCTFSASSCQGNSTGVRGCETPGDRLGIRATGGALS